MCSRKSNATILSALGAVAASAATLAAHAQICGYLELEKARKREALPRVEKAVPWPLVQLAPRPARNLREEYEQAVRDFEREASEYRKDVAAWVRVAYRQKRATLDRMYEQRIREVESEEREWRDKAIARLEAFVARYPDDAEHTPIRMAQLGELYFERSNEQFNRAQEEYERALEELRKGRRRKEPEPPVVRYDKTIEIYRRLWEKFPDYADLDGIAYILGYALASQGEEAEAARIYETFVRRFPRSRFLPEVWTRLGEHYFEQRPRKLREAIAAYAQVLPYRDSGYWDKALYKMAWAHYLDNQFDAAVRRFTELVEFSDAEKEKLGRAGSELRAEAIQYIGLSFTEEGWGGVDKAAKWYEGNRKPYVREILVRLADLLFDATKYAEAIRAYEIALARYPLDPESPRMLGCVVVSYRMMRDFVNEARMAERIPVLFGTGSPWYEANKGNRRALREVDALAQGSLLAAATFRHKQANVYAEAREVGRAKAEYSVAADLYRKFLDRFPTSKDAYELTFYLAETLYYAFRFEEAAAVYERVRDDPEEKSRQVEAALGAFKSLENWIDAQRLPRPAFPRLAKEGQGLEGGPGPDPMPSHMLRLVKSGNEFLRLAPKHEQAPNVAYVIAELYYRYKDFSEARARFEQIIDRWPRTKAASNAARLIVDSYRLTFDWVNVEKWTRRLLAARIAEGEDRKQLQEDLGKLKSGAIFKRAEALQKAGQHEEAAREYTRLADENPGAEFADIALYNAGANFEQIRKYESANRAYEKLLRRYPRSSRADKALFRIAVNAENFFEFDRAVKAYLALYRDYPRSDKRDWALYNAALALENDQRYADAARYFLTYAREFPEREDAPAAFFRAGNLYLKAKDYSQARRTFAAFISRFGADARYRGIAIEAQAKIADSWAAQGNRRQARVERRKVVELYDRSGYPPGSAAAVAAARAHFLEIEEDFSEFQIRRISGSAQRQAELLVELSRDLRRLESEYRSLKRFKVLDWYLAALFRIGHLYQLLSQKMLDAPMPAEIRTQEERDAYRTQLEDKAGVLERKALANLEIAYNEGKTQGVANEWTARALETLALLNPVKYRVMKEPRSAVQMETVSPAPIVRGPPEGAARETGGEWKPAGK
jgi:TolA-binding protein